MGKIKNVGRIGKPQLFAWVLAISLFAAGMAGFPAKASLEGEAVAFRCGFEDGGLGGWSGKDGAVVTVERGGAHSGSCCMKISGRKAAYSGAKLEVGSWLQEGRLLKVSAYARYLEGPKEKTVQLTLACGGKYYTVGRGSLLAGAWGEVSGSFLLPEGVGLSNAVLYFETPWTPNPSASQDFMDLYVDDVEVSMAPLEDTGSYPSLKERYQGQFLVGVAAPDDVLGVKPYSDLILQQFNSMTMENEMKPAYILDEGASKGSLAEYKEGAALDFSSFRAGMGYAKEHGIKMRGHTLIWHSQTPEWFFYENYDTSGPLASRELMLKRMENYIKGVIGWTEQNYPGLIYAWDVVNEAVADYFGAGPAPMRQEDSLWYQTIGDDFVEKAFAFARKYAGQYAPGREVKLFYNDYNEYFPAKREGIIRLLEPIREAGNIDGVGMQSHIDTARPLEGDSGYLTAVREFRDRLGLEIQVTELDVGIAKGDTAGSQGTYYQKLMEGLLREKKAGADITCVTFWGLSDALSWRAGEQGLLFSERLGRKPAFDGVADAIGNAGEVMGKINAIGDVSATEASKAKIAEARKAYDALTKTQKEFVSNYSILEAAERRYQELMGQQEAEESLKKALKEAEEAKAAAEKAKEEAEKEKAAAQKAKEKAEKEKAAAQKAKEEAEKEKAAAQKAREEAEREKAAAQKAKEEAKEAKAAVQKMKKDLEKAQAEAKGLKKRIEKVQKEIQDVKKKWAKALVGKASIRDARKAKNGQVKVRWKKVPGVTGYELQYTSNGTFTKANTKIIPKSKAEYVIKKQKGAKTYQIRIRAFKSIGGEKAYGAYSGIRKVKVK